MVYTVSYRPPQESNKYMYFNELNETLSKVANRCENIIVIGDLNIDAIDPDSAANRCKKYQNLLIKT